MGSKSDIGGKGLTPPKKIVVLGVGNELLSDEGVGVTVAKKLLKMNLPAEVEVIEGGTEGFGLLHIITQTDNLIVIDSVKGGGLPGSIYKFNIEDTANFPDLYKTSMHQIGILEVINLSSLVGKTPKTTVIGIEPKTILSGMELSAEIRAKIPKVIEIVLDEIKK